MPDSWASISLPSACVGYRPCRPVRSCGSAPIGLKYRSEITRSGVPAAISANIPSHSALVLAYGLPGSIGESSSTLPSGPGW